MLYKFLSIILLICLFGCQQPQFFGVDVTDSKAFNANLIFTDVNDKTINLSTKSENNQVTLVSFGYTSCPDYCPTTLAKIVAIEKMTNKKLKVVFISVDAKNDSKQIVKEYLKAFSPNYIGIVPTNKQLEQIKTNFKIVVIQEKNSINHTTGMYALDSSGKLRLYLPYNLEIKQIVSDLDNL